MEHTVQKESSRKGKGGPKTAEGKTKSALNAVTHGLTAQQPVALWFEEEEAWAAFSQGIVASLAPVGAGEHALAEKIALTLWRQNRVAAYETHRTNRALEAAPGEVERDLRPDHSDADAEARMRAKLTERLLLPDLELQKLQRYESHLGRELSRLFKHLHQLQDRRRQEPPAVANSEPEPGPARTVSPTPVPVTPPSVAPLIAAPTTAPHPTSPPHTPPTHLSPQNWRAGGLGGPTQLSPASIRFCKTNSPTSPKGSTPERKALIQRAHRAPFVTFPRVPASGWGRSLDGAPASP